MYAGKAIKNMADANNQRKEDSQKGPEVKKLRTPFYCYCLFQR